MAVAEVHRGRLDEATALIGGSVRGYGDFRRLLDDRGVDAVVVSTPDHWHALMTMMACAAGKDVYVEKPLTLFVREGRWMIDVARRHGRVVQVGTQQRSGPHYQRARELIRDGHLGRVSSVRMASYRNIMPGFGNPPDGPPPEGLDWDMMLGPAPYHAYNPNRALYHFRWFWDYSGGQMTNLGQHALDIVHWCLGLEGPSGGHQRRGPVQPHATTARRPTRRTRSSNTRAASPVGRTARRPGGWRRAPPTRSSSSVPGEAWRSRAKGSSSPPTVARLRRTPCPGSAEHTRSAGRPAPSGPADRSHLLDRSGQ